MQEIYLRLKVKVYFLCLKIIKLKTNEKGDKKLWLTMRVK
jgi:hypothetical protein